MRLSRITLFLLLLLGAATTYNFAQTTAAPTSRPNLNLKLTPYEMQWVSDHPTVSVGIDKHWYPYEFVDEQGVYSGIAADYLDFAGKVLNIDFTIVETQTWNKGFELFKQQKIDLLPAIIPTDERQQSIQFTQPYFTTPTVIVSRKNAFYATSIESLEGKKLALVRGFAIVEYISNAHPEIDIHLVDSIKQGLMEVKIGEADAYVGAISGINTALSQKEFSQLIISAFTPFKLEVAMAVTDEMKPLANILNKVFAGMSNRQRAAIANTWLSVHVEQGISLYTILVWGVPPFLFLSLIVLVIFKLNKGLHKEIDRRREVEQQLKQLSHHDHLTKLPNRRLFEELAHFSLAKAKREFEKHAVLFIDIDGFKSVNDQYGHQVGDELLKLIALRLRSCIRDSDIIARHGGDEFLILLNNDATPDYSSTVAKKIIEAIRQPYPLKESIDTIGASIGIATFPDDAEELILLIELADAAMYQAKRNGKNRFVFCTP